MQTQKQNKKTSIKSLVEYAATCLADPPRYQTPGAVYCRGEVLAPIVWQGRQWAVTKYGLECRDGTYCIDRRRLWENEDEFGWVMHLSEKTWADLPDFAEALRIARHTHRRKARC